MSTALLPSSAPTSQTPPRPARWLEVVSHTDPRYGGLSSAVPRLSQSVAAAGPFDVSLAAFCAPDECFRPASLDKKHISFWPTGRRPWLTSRELRRAFQEEVRAVDALHIHGLWEASTAIASRTARALGKPYVVSAHGMLEPWALANKRLKKLVYAHLVEHAVVRNAACLHALTHAEAMQYRAFGATGPIAVIPNAVDVPKELSPELFFEAYPALRTKRVVLFLGRLHPKKGLDLLAAVWGRVAAEHPEAHLVLAGPDAEGTADKIRTSFAAAGALPSVSLTGMLDSPMKWSALAAAELFVLPSYSEGLSMGALEAMGAGLPVIVTRHCNMPEVTRYGGGWEVEANPEALATALDSALHQTVIENRAAGRRGSDLITNRYNSRHVATAMAEVYRYIANGIPPENVTLL